jgi:hypothetical protein
MVIPNKNALGQWLQVGGAAVAALGVVLALKHLPIAACFVGGAAAFFAGKFLRQKYS